MASFGVGGIAIPGGKAIPGGIAAFPPRICFIILEAALNFSTNLFTSDTWRPDPRAIRARREPLSILRSRRSAGVID